MRVLAVVVALLLAVPGVAAAQPPDDGAKLAALRSGEIALRVGMDATFPPFEFTDAGGEKIGFDVELVRELAKRAGVQRVEFAQMPFATIVPGLQANQIDVGASSIYITEERAKVVAFTDVYYPGGLAIFVDEKDTAINSLADLAGKRVAVQVGTKSVDWLAQHQPAAQLVTVLTNEQMFSSVRLGQADAVVTGAPGGKYFIAQQGGLKQVGERLTDENYGYALQKGDPRLREALNAALEQMRDDGTYAQLTGKWFGPDSTVTKAAARPLFDITTITASWGQIQDGLLVSLQVIVLSLVLGLVLGMVGGFAKLSRIAPVRWLGNAYVSVIRGTPFVVQLFFIYFGLPQLGLQLPPMVAGIAALGLYSGSYVTEIFRGAVQSVARGQLEAAYSTGMTHIQAMRHVVIPQAFLRMLPPLGNEFVSLTKNSALVSFVTIHELFLVGQTIISRTFDAITVYLVIGLIYYLLTSIIGGGTRWLERRLSVYL